MQGTGIWHGHAFRLSHLPTIDGLGMCGKKWKQRLACLLVSAHCLRRSQLIVVHLGKNDLAQLSAVDLIKAIVKDFCSFEQLFLVLLGLTCFLDGCGLGLLNQSCGCSKV